MSLHSWANPHAQKRTMLAALLTLISNNFYTTWRPLSFLSSLRSMFPSTSFVLPFQPSPTLSRPLGGVNMSPPPLSVSEGGGTNSDSQPVASTVVDNTAETTASIPEDQSTFPVQAALIEADAAHETASRSITSPSEASNGDSDIYEKSVTDSPMSLAGTEITTMRRQRTVDRIMQCFCQHLDQILRDRDSHKPTELDHHAENQSFGLKAVPVPLLNEPLPFLNNFDVPSMSSFFGPYDPSLPSNWGELVPGGHMEAAFLTSLLPPSWDSAVCLSESRFGETSKDIDFGEQDGCSKSLWVEAPMVVRHEDDLLKDLLVPPYPTATSGYATVPHELEEGGWLLSSSKLENVFEPQFSRSNLRLGVNIMTSDENNLNDEVRKRAGANDSDHDGRRKKQKGHAYSGRKFACPFFKRNPRKFSKWTSCPGPGWDEVHRVKYATPTHTTLSTWESGLTTTLGATYTDATNSSSARVVGARTRTAGYSPFTFKWIRHARNNRTSAWLTALLRSRKRSY